jgi:ribosomal protein L37AE/L43A
MKLQCPEVILMDENTLNPTMNDISVCPFCENETFYHTDYNRVFCSKCRKEVRNGKEFKAGKLLNTKPTKRGSNQ